VNAHLWTAIPVSGAKGTLGLGPLLSIFRLKRADFAYPGRFAAVQLRWLLEQLLRDSSESLCGFSQGNGGLVGANFWTSGCPWTTRTGKTTKVLSFIMKWSE